MRPLPPAQMPPADIYPRPPKSPADLAPLPGCPGPKLGPFNFGGRPQEIKYLEYLGPGSHSHVFKVEILGQIYVLKLVSRRAVMVNSSPRAKWGKPKSSTRISRG